MPRRAQIAVGGVAVVTLFMLFFVVKASTSTTWQPVTDAGLSADKVGEAQTALEKEGIDNRQASAGGGLEVPADMAPKAAAVLMTAGLAAKGAHATCADMFGADSSMSFSDTSKKTDAKLENCEEGQTANDIEKIDGVSSASVDVTMADQSLFTDSEQPAKASVVLDTEGAQLSSKTIKGIQATVSSRFQDLKPRAVSVSDETGETISQTDEEESSSNDAKKLEIESKYNQLVEAKLTRQFEKIVGEGNVQVLSNAELDMDQIQREVEEYTNPDGGQPIVELADYEKELLRGADGATATGVTGVAPNGGDGVDPTDRRLTTDDGTASATGDGDYAKDKGKETYAVNKVREAISDAPGDVLRNRGAVIVDESVDESSAQAVKNAMEAWMGGNSEDSLAFNRARLASAHPVDTKAAAGGITSGFAGYVKWALLGVGLVGLAFVLRRTLTQRTAELLAPADDLLMLDAGDFTPIPIAELEAALAAGAPDKERQARIDMQRKVEQIADAKPQDVANEIRRWMTTHHEDAGQGFGQSTRRAS
jgi:flagellar M-ring protein FliF